MKSMSRRELAPFLMVFLGLAAVTARGDDWTVQADAPSERAGACIGIIGSSIYQAYGEGPNLGTFSNSVHQYDISAFGWTVLADATGPERSQGAQAVDPVNGQLYCIGGRNGSGVLANVDRFTPGAGWESRASLPSPGGAGAGAAFVATRNSIFLLGGRASANPCQSATNQILRYDIDGDAWAEAGTLQEARADATVVESGGSVYVFGGCNESGNLKSVEKYDPVAQQSALLAVTLPDLVNSIQTGATASPDKIHITGGFGGQRNSYGVFIVSTEQFQPELGPPLASCGTLARRSQHGLVYHDETQTLYAVSGLCSITNIAPPEEFPIPSLHSLSLAGSRRR